MRSLGGLPEVPCVKCERRVPGLRWGEYCPSCLAERRVRAERIARRVAQGAGLLMVLWVFLRLPNTVTARAWGAVIVAGTYVLVRQITIKLAMEYLSK